MKKISCVITLICAVFSYGCNNKEMPVPRDKDEPAEAAPFFDTHWQLTELEGRPVVLVNSGAQKPYLLFSETEYTVKGSTSCNTFGAVFELKGPDGITIRRTSISQANCPNIDLETRFLDVLENANGYQITADTLLLRSEMMSPAAKFKKVVQ